jgi:flagellar hook-associated protein 3 FlgL
LKENRGQQVTIMTYSITGIPTTRITASFTRDQLLRQTQFNQSALNLLMDQLSSGYQFQNPSEDPIPAMQTIGLQRLIQRKDQVKTNLETTQSYLGATDTALSNITGLLINARTNALGVVGTTTTEIQRQTAAQQINQTIQQLVDTGNQQFRGRYLFSGSESLYAPFTENSAGLIAYQGNDQHLMSYSDLNLLTSTNVTGNEAFGAISAEVKGTSTIIPTLTYDTRLTDLRQGQGISKGSIAVSDGTKNPDGSLNEITIDLSSAKTIGDVAALIKANPPNGRQLYVDITNATITIQLDPALGGNLTIREVGSGTVAEQLGIRNEMGTGINPIIGRPLAPILRNTTSLDTLFGSYALAVVHSPGTDNDIRLKADVMGEFSGTTALNDINVVFQPDIMVSAGNEFVDPITAPPGSQLIVHVAADGLSQAFDVVNAINHAHDVLHTIPFSAEIDPLDDVNGGLGYVQINASAVTQGGGGEPFDKEHGLQVVNNNNEQTISFALAETLGDVLNTLNGSGTGVLAQLNQTSNGVNLLSSVSGCDFEVGENGGKTANQFGIRSTKNLTPLSDLNYGRGVSFAKNSYAIMAEAAVNSTATNANLTITAKASVEGPPASNYWNGYAIVLVDTGNNPPTVNFDTTTRTVTIGITQGTTTANDVVQAFSGSAAGADFAISTAANADGTPSNGTGKVDTGIFATSGATPIDNDFTITRSDGVVLYLNVSQARNVENIIDAINNDPKNIAIAPNGKLVARQAAYGNGIELEDFSGGPGDVVVTKNTFSQAAIDLGLVPTGQTTSNPGIYDHSATLISAGDPQSGILIHGRDPSSPINGINVIFANSTVIPPKIDVTYSDTTRTLTVGYPAGTTAQQVIDAINDSSAAVLFQAELAPIANDGSGSVSDCGPFAMTGGTALKEASVTAVIPGLNNDLTFTTTRTNSSYNNASIQFTGQAVTPTFFDYDPMLDIITVHYNTTDNAGAGTFASQIITAWADPLNWPVGDTTNQEVSIALDPADGTPNTGLGLVADTSATITPMTTGTLVLTGTDVNPQETQGIFTALLRMRDAMMTNNQSELARSVSILDQSSTNLNFTRAELGAREQGLDMVQNHLTSENIDLRTALSENHDVDFVQVVSDLTARQTAYQASLMALGKIMQATLLNYL